MYQLAEKIIIFAKNDISVAFSKRSLIKLEQFSTNGSNFNK
tara:strand:+ start:37 stop:159 length:123 start_codon:yes stop_codon:yes gene_type:complete